MCVCVCVCVCVCSTTRSGTHPGFDPNYHITTILLQLSSHNKQTAVHMPAQPTRRDGAAQVTTPRPLPGLVRPEVMVETWEDGRSVSHYIRYPHPSLNGRVVCLGLDTYLKMLLQDNFVHTDLHPGEGRRTVAAAAGGGGVSLVCATYIWLQYHHASCRRVSTHSVGPLYLCFPLLTPNTCINTRHTPHTGNIMVRAVDSQGRPMALPDSGGATSNNSNSNSNSSNSTHYSEPEQPQQLQAREGRGHGRQQQPRCGGGDGTQCNCGDGEAAGGAARRPQRQRWWMFWRPGGRVLHGALSLARAASASATGRGHGHGNHRAPVATAAATPAGGPSHGAVAAFTAAKVDSGGAGTGGGEGEAGVQLVLLDFGLAEELSPVVRHHFISFLQHLLRGEGGSGGVSRSCEE